MGTGLRAQSPASPRWAGSRERTAPSGLDAQTRARGRGLTASGLGLRSCWWGPWPALGATHVSCLQREDGIRTPLRLRPLPPLCLDCPLRAPGSPSLVPPGAPACPSKVWATERARGSLHSSPGKGCTGCGAAAPSDREAGMAAQGPRGASRGSRLSGVCSVSVCLAHVDPSPA